jgi:hypothetical protein
MVFTLWLSCAASTSPTKATKHSAAPTTSSVPVPPPHSTPPTTSTTGQHSGGGSNTHSAPCEGATSPSQALAELTWPGSGNESTECQSSNPLPGWTLESYRAQLVSGGSGGGYSLYAAYLYRCTGTLSDGWTWVRVYPNGYDVDSAGALFDVDGALVGYADVAGYWTMCCAGESVGYVWKGAPAPSDIACSELVETIQP